MYAVDLDGEAVGHAQITLEVETEKQEAERLRYMQVKETNHDQLVVDVCR